MNPIELVNFHEGLCATARSILEKKNRDYRGASEDPFSNFRASAILGVPPEIGILIRCVDKFKRLEAFIQTGTLAVKNESAQDAVLDVINYMVLLAAMMRDKNEPS